MTGSSAIKPDLKTVRAILDGARKLGGAEGAVLELCTLTLCMPWQAAAIDIEQINWRASVVNVPARGGRTHPLYLPDAALKCVLRVAGSVGGSGQAITAGRGVRVQAQHIRLDRLQDRLASVSPAAVAQSWNIHGIRLAAAEALHIKNIPSDAIEAALGRRLRFDSKIFRPVDVELVMRAQVAIDAWVRILEGGGD